MHKISLVLLVSGLLLGASRCDKDPPEGQGGVGEGSGSAGRAGDARDAGASNGGAEPGSGGDPASSGNTSSPACGGIAGRGCPGAGQCVDDTSDDCDPAHGGADCGGVCVCRALARCGDGEVWNASPAVCGCESADGSGDDPGDPSDPSDPGDPAEGEACGNVTCAAGQVCCNPSCGICTAPGGSCTEQFCGDPEPEGVACGANTCAAGEVCCNESCGICTPPDGACDQQLCGDPEPEYGPFCGGFGGFGCPGSGTCVDDPRDDCDPEHGGADCGGVCECGRSGDCPDGSSWNSDPNVCACEGAGGGESCGSNTCPSGQQCCNASCGICAPPGSACIQIACL
jgi:hypothetical protein